MKKFSFMFVCLLAFIVGGCTSTVQIGSYQNQGDHAPLIYSSQLINKDFKNLSDGEAIAIAIGNEKAIARPNLTEMHIYKNVRNTSNSDFSLDLKICDPDGDGILDLFCPAKKKIADDNGSEYFDLTAIKFVQDKSGDWQYKAFIDRDSVYGNVYSGKYRIILLNSGTKTYTGPLVAYDRLEPAMTYSGIRSVKKVVDHRDLRSNLALVPYIGLVTLAMDDFSTTSDSMQMVDKVIDGIVKFESQSLTLSPGEGIQIDFGVNLVLP
jgi:hypothetical protein